jgi:hypothetical protein
MTGPVTAILLVAHVVAVVVAYGALGTTGVSARAARTATDPFASDRLARYFRPGHNLAARALYLVPAFGFGLLLAEPTTEFSRAYPWIGLTIWTVSIAIATSVVWPHEAEIQTILAGGRAPGARMALRAHCRAVERASGVLVVLFVAAVVVMIARV